MDPLEMLLNPEDTTIEVSFIPFMPYDWVKWGVGNHMGDTEHTAMEFVNGVPSNVTAHYHEFYNTKDYAKVEKHGDHPVTYNARGTHATYFKHGR